MLSIPYSSPEPVFTTSCSARHPAIPPPGPHGTGPPPHLTWALASGHPGQSLPYLDGPPAGRGLRLTGSCRPKQGLAAQVSSQRVPTRLGEAFEKLQAAAPYSIKDKRLAFVITGLASPANRSGPWRGRTQMPKASLSRDSQPGRHPVKLGSQSGQFPLQPGLRLHGVGGGKLEAP